MRRVPAGIFCSGCTYDLRGLSPARRCPECGCAIALTIQDIRRRHDRSANAKAILAAEAAEMRLPLVLLAGGVLAIVVRMLVLDDPTPRSGHDYSITRNIVWPLFVQAVGAAAGFALAARLGFLSFWSYSSIAMMGAAVATASTGAISLIPYLGLCGGAIIVPLLLIWWLVRPDPADLFVVLLLVWGTMVVTRIIGAFGQLAFVQ